MGLGSGVKEQWRDDQCFGGGKPWHDGRVIEGASGRRGPNWYQVQSTQQSPPMIKKRICSKTLPAAAGVPFGLASNSAVPLNAPILVSMVPVSPEVHRDLGRDALAQRPRWTKGRLRANNREDAGP